MNKQFDLQLFARPKKSAIEKLPIPEELTGLSEETARKYMGKAIEQQGIKPEALVTSSGESPNLETNPVLDEGLENTGNDLPTEQEPESQEVVPSESEIETEEPEKNIDPKVSEQPIQTAHPKGNLDIALKEEREKNKALKAKNTEWESKFNSLSEKIDQLSKQAVFSSVPIQQPANSEQSPFAQLFPTQQPIQHPIQQQVIPQQPIPQPVPRPAHNQPSVPEQSQLNPAAQYWQEINRQAQEKFKTVYGHEPRTDIFDDNVGVIRDAQLFGALQNEVQLNVNKQIQAEQEKKQQEQQRVQSTIKSYRSWISQEEKQPDFQELQPYLLEQLKSLPKDNQSVIVSSLGKLEKPETYGMPTTTDVVMAQNFLQLCRSQYAHQKIAQMQQQEQPPMEEIPQEAVLISEQQPVQQVNSAKQKADNLKQIPRTGFVQTASTSTTEWTPAKCQELMKQGKWLQIPEQYRNALLQGVGWPTS